MNREELSSQCARCGKIAEGYAFIGDDRYCHPDGGVDCYTLASHDLTTLANQAFIEKAQAPTDYEREAAPSYDEQEALATLLIRIREAYYPAGLEALSCDEIAFAILAAGVAPQPEPEYEYRLVLELHPPMRASWDQAETLWYPTVEEARATGKAQNWIACYRRDYPRARFTERVERRVIAGEAESVPNQEGEPS